MSGAWMKLTKKKSKAVKVQIVRKEYNNNKTYKQGSSTAKKGTKGVFYMRQWKSSKWISYRNGKQ